MMVDLWNRLIKADSCAELKPHNSGLNEKKDPFGRPDSYLSLIAVRSEIDELKEQPLEGKAAAAKQNQSRSFRRLELSVPSAVLYGR